MKFCQRGRLLGIWLKSLQHQFDKLSVLGRVSRQYRLSVRAGQHNLNPDFEFQMVSSYLLLDHILRFVLQDYATFYVVALEDLLINLLKIIFIIVSKSHFGRQKINRNLIGVSWQAKRSRIYKHHSVDFLCGVFQVLGERYVRWVLHQIVRVKNSCYYLYPLILTGDQFLVHVPQMYAQFYPTVLPNLVPLLIFTSFLSLSLSLLQFLIVFIALKTQHVY